MPPTTELLTVHPDELIFKANVRADLDLDPEFVHSVREHGVLQPITAYRAPDGLTVLWGHRRTLAARATARPDVPVLVVDEPDTLRRLATQLTENDHRAGITTRERVAAYEQMTLEGATPEVVALLTARPRAEVDAALTVARSKTATAAISEHTTLTLDQAALLAEFDGDDKATTTLLETFAKGWSWQHTVARLREDRREAELLAEAREKAAAEGLRVIDQPPHGSKISTLDYLTDAKGKPLTDRKHRSCSGHAVYARIRYNHTGTSSTSSAHLEPVCTDPAGNGHQHRYGNPTAGKKTAAEMTPEEREAASAERRDVIESNKAWRAARTVRQEWLRNLLARKTAPKLSARFVVAELARGTHDLRRAMEDHHKLAHELLGLSAPTWEDPGTALIDLAERATPARAELLILGMILTAYEAGLSDNAWRNGLMTTKRYLRYLEGIGYELSPIERRACGEQPTADGES